MRWHRSIVRNTWAGKWRTPSCRPQKPNPTSPPRTACWKEDGPMRGVNLEWCKKDVHKSMFTETKLVVKLTFFHYWRSRSKTCHADDFVIIGCPGSCHLTTSGAAYNDKFVNMKTVMFLVQIYMIRIFTKRLALVFAAIAVWYPNKRRTINHFFINLFRQMCLYKWCI